jgi:hypothetical protein
MALAAIREMARAVADVACAESIAYFRTVASKLLAVSAAGRHAEVSTATLGCTVHGEEFRRSALSDRH